MGQQEKHYSRRGTGSLEEGVRLSREVWGGLQNLQVWKELRRLEMKELQVGAQCGSQGPTGGREPAASVRIVILPEGATGTLGGG